MEQKQSIQNKPNNDQGEKQCCVSPAVTMIAIAVWIFIGLTALLWFVISDNIVDEAKRFEIGIVAMLNIAIVIIVVVHAVIYHQQTKSMTKQADLAAKQIDLLVQNESARMGVRSIKPIGLDGKARMAVQITFRNGGKSPAFEFRDNATVNVVNAGESAPKFEWRDITPIFRRSFIPAGEDRSTIVSFFGLEDPGSIIDGSRELLIDGEARYSILGGQNRILCFAGTYHPGDRQFQIATITNVRTQKRTIQIKTLPNLVNSANPV